MRLLVFTIFFALAAKLVCSYGAEKESVGLANYIYTLSDIVIFACCSLHTILYGQVRRFGFILALSAAMLLLNMFTWLLNGTPLVQQLTLSLKILVPFIFLISMHDAANRDCLLIDSLKLGTLLLVVLLAVYGIVFLPREYNRLEYWWPAYFGGLHTTAYVWLAGLVLWLATRKYDYWSWLIIGVSFAMLFWGWGVRTATYGLLLFVFYYFVFAKAGYLLKGAIVSTIVLLLMVALMVTATDQDVYSKLDFYSSGRLSMYLFKFNLMLRDGPLEILFGSGAGADLVVSDVWWWEEKGSHNDFMTIFFEQGFIYLLCFLVFLGRLFFIFRGHMERGVLLIYVFTSFISNGYVTRPLPSYLLMLALSCFIVANLKSRHSRTQQITTA